MQFRPDSPLGCAGERRRLEAPKVATANGDRWGHVETLTYRHRNTNATSPTNQLLLLDIFGG
jgi:hypothetical protein